MSRSSTTKPAKPRPENEVRVRLIERNPDTSTNHIFLVKECLLDPTLAPDTCELCGAPFVWGRDLNGKYWQLEYELALDHGVAKRHVFTEHHKTLFDKQRRDAAADRHLQEKAERQQKRINERKAKAQAEYQRQVAKLVTPLL